MKLWSIILNSQITVFGDDGGFPKRDLATVPKGPRTISLFPVDQGSTVLSISISLNPDAHASGINGKVILASHKNWRPTWGFLWSSSLIQIWLLISSIELRRRHCSLVCQPY